MKYNKIKDIKEYFIGKGIECKTKDKQRTLVIELKDYSFLIDKRDDTRFDVSIFENTDYELVEMFLGITGFETIKKVEIYL